MSTSGSLTELVIAQVKSRPVLWDKKHEMYGNIQAMDYEWNKLSALMKRDSEYICFIMFTWLPGHIRKVRVASLSVL